MAEEFFTFQMVKFLKELGVKEKSMDMDSFRLMEKLLKVFGIMDSYNTQIND